MRRFATAFTAATASLAALAAAAEAATLTISPARGCYLAGQRVTVTGTGFTANATVGVSLDGAALGALPASPAGVIAATLRLGGMRGVKPHTVTATDTVNPAVTASAAFLGTTNMVTVKPENSRPGKKRRIHGYGFLAGPRVYMHVRGPGGYKGDKKIARPAGPCGTFATRRRIVGASARPGRYKVQFDAKQRYSKRTRPRVRGTLTVFRTSSPGAARASAFGGVTPLSGWTTVAG